MTVHWIDSGKAAICCVRIVGRNGSNFVKAFTSFSLPRADHTSTTSDTIVSPNPFMEEDNLDPNEGRLHLKMYVIL